MRDSDRVHSIILFGSVAKDEDREDSDIDLCIVEKERRKIDLDEKIKMGRDLPKKVELSFFQNLPLDIRGRVFREGKVLYTEDKFQLLKLLEKTNFELPYYTKKKKEYHNKAMKKAKAKVDDQ